MSEYATRLARRIETLDTMAADNRRRAENYRQVEDDLKAVSAEITSPDGVVTVVAGPGGAITSITFSERVRGVDPAVLSATAQETISTAVAEVARLQAEVVRQGLGSAEPLDRVTAVDERLFGDQKPRSSTAPVEIPKVAADEEYSFDELDFFASSDER